MKLKLSSRAERRSKIEWHFGFLLVLFIASGVFLFVYHYLLKSEGPFFWDEAHHSTYSLLIAKSLLQKNWSEFWRHTNAQIYWPFLHSWVSAIFLMIGGFSYQTARFVNMVIGFISVIIIYLTGSKLVEKEGHRVGVLAALLMLFSPMFLLYSTTAMIENLGLLIGLIIILLQFIAWEEEERKARFYFISGVALALLYLTKYIYALLFGTALLCFWTSLIFFPDKEIKREVIWKNIWFVALGFFLIWGAWIAIPPSAPKLNVLMYRIKDTGGCNPFGFTKLDNRTFYLRALLYAYTFSVGIYILYIGGLVYGLITLKKAKIRLLLLIFLTNVTSMSLIVNSQERFIYLTTPALYLLTAYFINWFWFKMSKIWRYAVLITIGMLFWGDSHKLPSYMRQLENYSLGICLFKIKNEFNYSTFFGLASYPKFLRFPKEPLNPKARNVLPQHNTENVLDFVWENTHPQNPICAPFYVQTLSPWLWRWHSIIKNRPVFTNWNPASHYFVSLRVDEDSPYFTLMNRGMIEGRTHKWDALLDDLQTQGLMKTEREKYFPDIGLRVKIYVKNVHLNNPIWRQIRFP